MFIETLAVEPGNEEECVERINHICDQYNESEEGKKFHEEVAEAASTADASKSAKEREYMTKTRKEVSFPIQVCLFIG
jgi:uncharacterized coiled-coil DUF342 family protein